MAIGGHCKPFLVSTASWRGDVSSGDQRKKKLRLEVEVGLTVPDSRLCKPALDET